MTDTVDLGATPGRPRAAPSRTRLAITLAVGWMAISVAGPLVVTAERGAGGVPGMAPAAIAFWRTFLAGSTMLAIALLSERRALQALTRRDYSLHALAGSILAIHYLLWMGSLSLTSVLSSTVLVTTNPLWVAVGASLFLGERTSRSTWLAIVAGMVGASVLALADSRTHPASASDSVGGAVLGDGMALAGAVASSANLLCGRALRRRIPFATYCALMTLFTAAGLIITALATRVPLLPRTGGELAAVLALAAVPHLIGNTILNWALGHVRASTVALVILGEPVGASLIAWVAFHQEPPALSLLGGALVLGAVAWGVRERA